MFRRSCWRLTRRKKKTSNPARQNGRTSSLLSTQTGCLQTRPSGTRPHRLIPVRLFVLEQVVPVPHHILDGRETGQGPYTVIRDAVPYHKLPGKHKPGGHYFFSFWMPVQQHGFWEYHTHHIVYFWKLKVILKHLLRSENKETLHIFLRFFTATPAQRHS